MDVFDRIRAALTGTPSSDVIRGAIAETKDAIDQQQRRRAELERTAANPLIDTAEADRAADQISRCHGAERRLAEALRLLGPKLIEVDGAERQAHQVGLHDAAREQRDEFISRFRKNYPRHAKAIADLMAELRAIDSIVGDVPTPVGYEALQAASKVLSADPARALHTGVKLPLVSLTDAPRVDHDLDLAEAAERQRRAEDEQMAATHRRMGLMRRWGTSDEGEVRRLQAEESRRQREAQRQREIEANRTNAVGWAS